MPTLTQMVDYNGVGVKISRLGLGPRYAELVDCVTRFSLLLTEDKHANGTKAIREQIDANFSRLEGWTKTVSGGSTGSRRRPPPVLGLE